MVQQPKGASFHAKYGTWELHASLEQLIQVVDGEKLPDDPKHLQDQRIGDCAAFQDGHCLAIVPFAPGGQSDIEGTKPRRFQWVTSRMFLVERLNWLGF
jgi:hypothetical protein